MRFFAQFRFRYTLIQLFSVRSLVYHAVFALTFAVTAGAQIDRAGLTGTVRDGENRGIPAARVTATHLATKQQYQTVTSTSGTYDLPELPIGHYRVSYSATGFQEKDLDSVEETVGHTRTLNTVLSVAGVTEQVEVTDVGGQLDQTSAALATRIEQQQVKQLPLNGRNWSTLTALAPGAVDTGGSNQRSIRFAGRGLDDNNFTYDGIDATNIVNQAQQPFVRLAIPMAAIEEFRIDTMLFTAEDGSTPEDRSPSSRAQARTTCMARSSSTCVTTSSMLTVRLTPQTRESLRFA